MAAILTDLRNTVIAGFVLAVILFLFYLVAQGFDFQQFMPFFWRWLHVLSGVMWIGLLWYFNFVQIPNMGKIPDEQKPAIGKVIAPAALFWFRAVLVIAPALAAAIFRVRFPALAVGTTLTTLYCAFVFLWAAVVEEEEVGDLPLPRQAAFIVLPPSIMMVICYMILSANLKAFTAFDSNRRQAAAVEEVVRTVGETSIAVTAPPNKAGAPACSARAG